MHKYRRKKLISVCLLLLGVGLGVSLILYALRQNINLFFTPSQALAHHLPTDYTFRLGGQVKPHTVHRDTKNLRVHFVLTDLHKDIPVDYAGILPDLFREGNGAIAEGHWNKQGKFIATQILAKHDENYMPKAVYEALRKKGTNLSS